MFTIFKRDASALLFVDPSVSSRVEYDRTKKVSIVLSPALYWVKKLSLPVKYARDVKKLLPSIFEETLPEGHYSYSVYKSGDEFFGFAYEDKKIIDLLSKNEINSADINGVYFAQSELSDITMPMEINPTQSLYVKDELVLLAPTTWFSEHESLNLSNITLSKHTIKLQQYGHIVDNSSLYKIGAMLGVLALLLLVEIFITTSKRDAILDAKDEIFSKYRLQPTMMQNRSTLAKYETIHERQSKLRESISYFLALKLASSQKITLMEYENKTLSVLIGAVKKGSESQIVKELKSKNLKFTSSFSEAGMRVEVKL